MRRLTWDNDRFYMNGEPYTLLSGAMHYFRIPREYWYDRLLKLKECGFNTVETYTCWNLHEPREGEFDFSGNLDVAKYIETAESLGLNVILRPGPYICAEWEFGGLPAWLLTYEKMPLRCNDTQFLSKVERYYNELLQRVRPYLASHGGNIIMIQLENEYGSYGDDKDYLRAIAAIYQNNGIDCPYFTSDGAAVSVLTDGSLHEYLAVVNFGSLPKDRLPLLKSVRPNQPVMCGEYWCGWFDHWFEEHHTRTAEEICTDFEGFFELGASLNFYMFHGGTNFGFMNGANHVKRYEPTVTSYDYCAPLNEAGDRTPTYYAVRDMIARYYGTSLPLTATETKKAAYGKVRLTEAATLFDNIDRISKPVHSAAPKYMEDLGQNYGYILYRSTITGPSGSEINVGSIRDRIEIFLDGEHRGTYCRWAPPTKEEKVVLSLEKGKKTRIDLLVENMGRINFGPLLRDSKGLDAVFKGDRRHFSWDIYCLPMEEELAALNFKPIGEKIPHTPTFFRGFLEIKEEPADTFLRLDGFTKGFVKINGVNIGRYFNEAGPQKTLFVPAPFLRRGKNEILVFESDCTQALQVEFFSEPDLG